jgi:predicted nuclease of predicted toxin-antitoxin system
LVTHLRDHGLERLPDPEILGKARREERVLLAHDLDFADLIAAAGMRLPSVIIFRLRNMSPESVNRYLQEVLSAHHDALERGAIIIVTEAQIRIRYLPI